jgi:hypothetical protein
VTLTTAGLPWHGAVSACEGRSPVHASPMRTAAGVELCTYDKDDCRLIDDLQERWEDVRYRGTEMMH